jgi:hypothetical protein
MGRPAQRQELAGIMVLEYGVGIGMASQVSGLFKTCYSYGLKLCEDNDQIADVYSNRRSP